MRSSPLAAGSGAPGVEPALLSLAFAFMLLVCRCGAAIMLLPALGESDPPMLLRAGLALALAVLLLPAVGSTLPPAPADLPRLALIIAQEVLVGGLLGWLARVAALALPAAGQIISLLTGLSSVLQPDPLLGAQSAVIGRLFSVLAPVVIFASGLHALPLMALAGSYAVFPAGMPLPAGDLAATAVRAAGAGFALSLGLAAPFVVIAVLWQTSLGLLSRLVPQIQIYFTALPAQILGGLLLLALLMATLLRVWTTQLAQAFAALP